MDEYFNELKRRNITRLCHFLQSQVIFRVYFGDGEFEKWYFYLLNILKNHQIILKS